MHPGHHRVTVQHCAWRRYDAALRRCHVLLMAAGAAQRLDAGSLSPGAAWKCSAGAERQRGDVLL